MNAFISMSIAVLIWSLYPLAATIGLQTMGALDMMLFVFVIASAGSALLGINYLSREKILGQSFQVLKKLPKRAYFLILGSGIAGVLAHCFFFLALTLADKGGVSLLFESWPVIAVVATPFLMKKTWKEVSLKEFIVSIIALIGVGFIIFSDKDVDLNILNPTSFASIDYTALGGYVLAFVGGYMVALVAVTQGAFSEYFKEINNDFGSTLVGQMLGRFVSVVLMAIIFMTFSDGPMDLSVNFLPLIYIGFCVFVLGGSLYTLSLLRTDQPTIHILYYLVPVLAVVWLWLIGEITINLGLIAGGAIIVASNIYLTFAGRRAKFSEPLE